MLHDEAMAHAWRAYAAGAERPSDIVRPEIARSWARCRKASINPWSNTRRYVDEARLDAVRNDHERMIRVADPVMRVVSALLACNVSLMDKQGYVYHLVSPFSNYSLTVGQEMREELVGTCNAALVQVENKPVRCDYFEHYRVCSQAYSGASAPFLHEDGSFGGAINLNSPLLPLPPNAEIDGFGGCAASAQALLPEPQGVAAAFHRGVLLAAVRAHGGSLGGYRRPGPRSDGERGGNADPQAVLLAPIRHRIFGKVGGGGREACASAYGLSGERSAGASCRYDRGIRAREAALSTACGAAVRAVFQADLPLLPVRPLRGGIRAASHDGRSPGCARRHRGGERRVARGHGFRRSRGAAEGEHPAFGGVGHGQGGYRTGYPRTVGAEGPLRRRELRRPSARPSGQRAVRLRPRRLHRSQRRGAFGEVRVLQRRHAVFGRDSARCPPICRWGFCACCRSGR